MYIFKFPAAADFTFTFDNIRDYIARGRTVGARKVGTTVELEAGTFGGQHVDFYRVWLYSTCIALVYRDRVDIPVDINHYGSQATGHWVSKVLYDNGIHRGVWRTAGKYEGVAGVSFPIGELVQSH